MDDAFRSGLVERAFNHRRRLRIGSAHGLLEERLQSGVGFTIAKCARLGLTHPFFGGFDIWHGVKYISPCKMCLPLFLSQNRPEAVVAGLGDGAGCHRLPNGAAGLLKVAAVGEPAVLLRLNHFAKAERQLARLERPEAELVEPRAIDQKSTGRPIQPSCGGRLPTHTAPRDVSDRALAAQRTEDRAFPDARVADQQGATP